MFRPLAREPVLLPADEPTGNLDTKTSVEIMGFLTLLNQEAGLTIVLVTHEPEIATYALGRSRSATAWWRRMWIGSQRDSSQEGVVVNWMQAVKGVTVIYPAVLIHPDYFSLVERGGDSRGILGGIATRCN